MHNNSNNHDDTLTYFFSKGHQLGAWTGYFESLSVILCRHFFLYGNILDFLNHFEEKLPQWGTGLCPAEGAGGLSRLSDCLDTSDSLIYFLYPLEKVKGIPHPSFNNEDLSDGSQRLQFSPSPFSTF